MADGVPAFIALFLKPSAKCEGRKKWRGLVRFGHGEVCATKLLYPTKIAAEAVANAYCEDMKEQAMALFTKRTECDQEARESARPQDS